jgi:hypothetical protein
LAETARINENKKKWSSRAHPFKAAEWTYPNGHPRCIRCGAEESIDGICHPSTNKSLVLMKAGLPNASEYWKNRAIRINGVTHPAGLGQSHEDLWLKHAGHLKHGDKADLGYIGHEGSFYPQEHMEHTIRAHVAEYGHPHGGETVVFGNRTLRRAAANFTHEKMQQRAASMARRTEGTAKFKELMRSIACQCDAFFKALSSYFRAPAMRAGGHIYEGRKGENHGMIYDRMSEEHQNHPNIEDGFVGHDGKFYSRAQASSVHRPSPEEDKKYEHDPYITSGLATSETLAAEKWHGPTEQRTMPKQVQGVRPTVLVKAVDQSKVDWVQQAHATLKQHGYEKVAHAPNTEMSSDPESMKWHTAHEGVGFVSHIYTHPTQPHSVILSIPHHAASPSWSFTHNSEAPAHTRNHDFNNSGKKPENLAHHLGWIAKLEGREVPTVHKSLVLMRAPAVPSSRVVLAKLATILKADRRLDYRTHFQGMPISIENQKGSIREWHDPENGRHGHVKMKYPYGYIRGTIGNDGDQIDCMLGPHKDASHAYVIRQLKPQGDGRWVYDEDKVQLGFHSAQAAKAAFMQHYDDDRHFGALIKVPMGEFRQAAYKTRHRPGPIHLRGSDPNEGAA